MFYNNATDKRFDHIREAESSTALQNNCNKNDFTIAASNEFVLFEIYCYICKHEYSRIVKHSFVGLCSPVNAPLKGKEKLINTDYATDLCL